MACYMGQGLRNKSMWFKFGPHNLYQMMTVIINKFSLQNINNYILLTYELLVC